MPKDSELRLARSLGHDEPELEGSAGELERAQDVKGIGGEKTGRTSLLAAIGFVVLGSVTPEGRDVAVGALVDAGILVTTDPLIDTTTEPTHVDPPEAWRDRINRLTRKGF